MIRRSFLNFLHLYCLLKLDTLTLSDRAKPDRRSYSFRYRYRYLPTRRRTETGPSLIVVDPSYDSSTLYLQKNVLIAYEILTLVCHR